MIELYILLGLAGIGYIVGTHPMSTTTKTVTKVTKPAVPPQPSANTLYNSTHVIAADHDTRMKAAALFEASKRPNETGIIGNNYRTVHSQLAGVDVNFGHNNMVPFFSGELKQNTDPHAHATLVEKFTGTTPLRAPKREMAPLFDPHESAVPDIAPGGAPITDFYQSRIEVPKARNNVLPFEQERVGPGLNAGYGTNPRGDALMDRSYAVLPTVDDLRKGSNPKQTYQGRVLPGRRPEQRGLLPNMEKHMPERYFEQETCDLLPTSAPTERDPMYTLPEAKPTMRECTTAEHVGGAGNSAVVKPALPAQSEMRLPRGDIEVDLPSGNLSSVVKALIAPYMDLARPTRKVLTSETVLPPMQAQIPPKMTVYDSDNVARTTIKETLIHDTSLGNLKGAVRIAVYDPSQIARTTGRQTLDDGDYHANVRPSKYVSITREPDSTARTTIRETTEHGVRASGAPSATEFGLGGYQSTAAYARQTQKETLSDNPYTGIAGDQGSHVPMSGDAAANGRVNCLREPTLIGRDPSDQGPKLFSDAIGEIITRNEACERVAAARNTGNRERPNGMASDVQCGVTRNRIDAHENTRFDVSLLDALKNNPYNQSILGN